MTNRVNVNNNPTAIEKKKLIEELHKGNRRALARAITLVESTRKVDFDASQEILQSILPFAGNSIRIGITGVPGVGKSTFIEALGSHLSSIGHKVAVLAVDPSSPYSGGSILGDKTRMQELSKLDSVFIRPSPTGGTLGGVSRKTRETILLCEAAGYDIILIETVGVGQSEYEVASMVDFFLLLLLPNAGDGLQGIKRGIMELADLIVVNKADGAYQKKAQLAAGEYQGALHLTRRKYAEYETAVLTCSALESKGIKEVWEELTSYVKRMKEDGLFDRNRNSQLIEWTKKLTEELLLTDFWKSDSTKTNWNQFQTDLRDGKITAWQAGIKLIEQFKKIR